MNKAVIISGNLAQDHEFIYPYYRLLEADFNVDVCLLEGKPVIGILGTTLPPNKDQPVKTIDQIKVNDYKKFAKENHIQFSNCQIELNQEYVVKNDGHPNNLAHRKYFECILNLINEQNK